MSNQSWVQACATIPDEWYRKLEARAKADGHRSMASLVRAAIRKFMVEEDIIDDPDPSVRG